MKNLEKYTNVFVENLQITAEQCKGLQYQGVELWDSVGHMTLVAALEDVFDVMLETDDIVDLSKRVWTFFRNTMSHSKNLKY